MTHDRMDGEPDERPRRPTRAGALALRLPAVGLALLVVAAGCTGPAGPGRSLEGSGAVAPPATGTPSGSAPNDGLASPGLGSPTTPADPSARPTASVPEGVATVPPSGQPVTGEVPEAVLASLLEDAAARTGADPATARILRAEAVTWSDGSLGCPEPDMFYTQALVPGYWVVIELGGQTLDYRVGAHGAFRLCEQPAPGAP